MPENKTQKTAQSVQEFLNSVEDEKKRRDSFAVLELMKEVTGEEPAMWGSSMVGFGDYHYRYESGREGDMMLTGFSPRKRNLTIYITSGFEQFGDLLEDLGKYTTGKSCLYVNRLEDVDIDVLRELVRRSVEHMEATNKT